MYKFDCPSVQFHPEGNKIKTSPILKQRLSVCGTNTSDDEITINASEMTSFFEVEINSEIDRVKWSKNKEEMNKNERRCIC